MLSARCSPVALLITCGAILEVFFFFLSFFPELFLGIDSFLPLFMLHRKVGGATDTISTISTGGDDHPLPRREQETPVHAIKHPTEHTALFHLHLHSPY